MEEKSQSKKKKSKDSPDLINGDSLSGGDPAHGDQDGVDHLVHHEDHLLNIRIVIHYTRPYSQHITRISVDYGLLHSFSNILRLY